MNPGLRVAPFLLPQLQLDALALRNAKEGKGMRQQAFSRGPYPCPATLPKSRACIRPGGVSAPVGSTITAKVTSTRSDVDTPGTLPWKLQMVLKAKLGAGRRRGPHCTWASSIRAWRRRLSVWDRPQIPHPPQEAEPKGFLVSLPPPAVYQGDTRGGGTESTPLSAAQHQGLPDAPGTKDGQGWASPCPTHPCFQPSIALGFKPAA